MSKDLDENVKYMTRNNISPQVIRTSYMSASLLLGNKISYDDIYDHFGISTAQYNKDIKALRLCTEVLFGEDALIVSTKEKMTYELILPIPHIRLNLGI